MSEPSKEGVASPPAYYNTSTTVCTGDIGPTPSNKVYPPMQQQATYDPYNPSNYPMADNYGIQQSFPTTQHVIAQQPSTIAYIGHPQPTLVVAGAYQQVPATHMVFSCVVLWLCNPVCGLIAFILSVLAQSAIGNNDYASARTLGTVALVLNIIALVMGIAIWIWILILIITI